MSFADPELEKLRQILTKKAAREREYIHIPFEQRGKARQAGAMWDTEKKSRFVGPYATRDRIEKFIRMNEEKDNEQRRQRYAGTERTDAGRERSGTGNATGANEPDSQDEAPPLMPETDMEPAAAEDELAQAMLLLQQEASQKE